MEINVENAQRVLKKYLEGTTKYEHSIRVARISKLLAEKWESSVSDAIIAALLHDIGKSMSKQQMLSLCVRNNITIYDFELFENLDALHGRISSLLFEEEFKGNDSKKIQKISHAISSHVAGDINMGMLDKIIFVADNLEGKEGTSQLMEQIKNGQMTLDESVQVIIKQKLQRNKERHMVYNPLLDAANKGQDIER